MIPITGNQKIKVQTREYNFYFEWELSVYKPSEKNSVCIWEPLEKSDFEGTFTMRDN
jgi:hypothetical protein